MYYIYLILAMILMGISVGALLGRRNQILLLGALISLALGVVTLFMPSWPPLAAGIAIYLLAQATQRETRGQHQG